MNGVFEFECRLFNASDPSFGSVIGPVLTVSNVNVNKGLFTVELDFGDVFDGNERWLELAVRVQGSGDPFDKLSPLQRLAPTPHAIYSLKAGVADFASSADNADLLDGLDSTDFLQTTGGTITGDLDVVGTVEALAFSLNGDVINAWPPICPWSPGTDGDIYYNGGEVGIGTSSPGTALEVVGTVTADGAVLGAQHHDCGKLFTDAAGNVLCGVDEGGLDPLTAYWTPLAHSVTCDSGYVMTGVRRVCSNECQYGGSWKLQAKCRRVK